MYRTYTKANQMIYIVIYKLLGEFNMKKALYEKCISSSAVRHIIFCAMADEKIIFSMAGVSKVYPPQKTVLKNIYLSFFYGAKIGVIGLNGSGKSSLIKNYCRY
jgi:ABC-type polysaccharide/polyol phosphate transport system ATPase subunit